MNLKNIQQVQNEIAIQWEDGTESFISLEKLRRCCPCAACSGERDIMGKEWKAPSIPYQPESLQLNQFQPVGGYAVNFVWKDGHHTGIYSYELLKKLGEVN